MRDSGIERLVLLVPTSRDGDLLGRVLDTFVVAQLRPEIALNPQARLHHVRTKSGRHEIDLVVDLGADG